MNTSLRLQRLSAEYDKIRELAERSPFVQIVEAQGDPPDKYILRLTCKGISGVANDQPIFSEDHMLSICLPADFPRVGPQFQMLTPVWHPNIASSGQVSYWYERDHGYPLALGLDDLVLFIIQMIRYENMNLNSAFNLVAAQWAARNQRLFPLDTRPIIEEKIDIDLTGEIDLVRAENEEPDDLLASITISDDQESGERNEQPRKQVEPAQRPPSSSGNKRPQGSNGKIGPIELAEVVQRILLARLPLPSAGERAGASKKYGISVACPKRLAKRFDSKFLFQYYLPEYRAQANNNIRAEFPAGTPAEYLKPSSHVRLGQTVTIEFSSADIAFSKPVKKTIDLPIVSLVMWGSPTDHCRPGSHIVKVSVLDEKGVEVDAITIEVGVADFAFDHISRPLLARTSAIVLGIGSLVMYLLTLLEQIDKTLGLASGTAITVAALAIYADCHNLYERVQRT